jgi:Ca2+:H+ antiporter
VVIGWMMGQEMDLNFQLFETATLFITVLVVAFMLQVCLQKKITTFLFPFVYEVTTTGCFAAYFFSSNILHFIMYMFFQEGTSNYFKGLMLILCYLIVAASFFVHVDPDASKHLVYCFVKCMRANWIKILMG